MNITNRNKSLTNLHKAADYLSRALRENLRVFTIDTQNDSVVFISEKRNTLSCSYEQNDSKLVLSNIVVESVEDYTSGERIDEKVKSTISDFVGSLREDRYDKSDTSFAQVLNLFEQRSQLDTLKYKVAKHLDSFGSKVTVLESAQYTKLDEVKPLMKEFIKENAKTLLSNEDIHSSLRIGNAIGKAFSLPQKTYQDLQEGNYFAIDLNEKSLYEMVCQQELIRQEILDAKDDISSLWVGNDAMQKVASCIYAKDDTIKEALGSLIEHTPYFALSTKASIQENLESIYEVNATDVIAKKDVKAFAKKIFEWKKPVKAALLETLNETYGINMNTLKFVPSFSNLAKTQSVMFEVLNLHCEEGVLSDVLKEFSSFISKKGGVEVLSVNDYILECFEEPAEDVLSENLLMQYVDIPRLGKDLSALKTLLVGDEGGMEGGMEGGTEEVPEEEGMEEELPEDEEGTGEEFPEEEGMEGELPEEEEELGEEVPKEEGMEEEVPGDEEGMEASEEDIPVGDDSGMEIPREPQSEGDSLVSDLEKLIAGLGMGGGMEEDEDEQYEP